MDNDRNTIQNTGNTEEASRQNKLRSDAESRLRKLIIKRIPYKQFRDEALKALDDLMRAYDNR